MTLLTLKPQTSVKDKGENFVEWYRAFLQGRKKKPQHGRVLRALK